MTTQQVAEDLERPPLATEETPLLPRAGSSAGRPGLRPRLAGKLQHRALIPRANTKIVTTKGVEIIHSGSKINYVDKSRDIDKIITFDPESILGWASMLRYQGTVFQMGTVIGLIAANASLGIAIAYFASRFPVLMRESFNTTMLDDLIKFLMVFLAFMTGMFVNGAFKRWQEVLQELFNLIQAVKQVYLDLAMHGAPKPALQDVRRWGTLSVALTALEAPALWEPPDWEDELNKFRDDEIINEEEKTQLLTKSDENKSALIWVWIVMKLQDLSLQGFTPPRTSIALAKMLDHCNMATKSINRVNELVTFQVPHQYMHMLAFLIHLFNIINTVRCGIEIGSAYETLIKAPGKPSALHIQSLVTYTCIMMLSPFIYQAFLCISLDISIPFGNGTTDVPIAFLLDRFQQEMDDMDECIKTPAPGSALPPSRPGTFTGSKFPPSSTPGTASSASAGEIRLSVRKSQTMAPTTTAAEAEQPLRASSTVAASKSS
mmetsp:Transcript_148279/g.284138  ORF Transcript_148279/g.284138 Transcript_148279/m.284138 type:complete len:490 (+) Transcript_148279:94-1563(+)